MFRMSKDFNARVYDEIRKHAVIEDAGAHLTALALLKPTIDTISQNISSSASNISSNNQFQLAVKFGILILESATNDQKEFASSKLLSTIEQFKERQVENLFSAAKAKQSKRRQRKDQENNNDNDSEEGSQSLLQSLLNVDGNSTLSLESSEEASLSEEVKKEFLAMMEFVVKDVNASQKQLFLREEEIDSLVDGL